MEIYKRSVFLINPKFQLKFSLIVGSIILISSLIYPVIIYDFFNVVAAANPLLPQKVIEARNDLIFYLILIQLILSLLIFVVFIFVTHKIAGPIYKMKNHLADIRAGGAFSPLTFRAGDHFQDVAEEVTLFLDTLAMNQENDFKYLDEVAVYVENLSTIIPDDKKPVLNEISRRLMDIQSRYKKNL
ncbi:MAG TPA: hypothetical protein VNJ01_14460 [Bacteriovoracaceae bacterium]|nr:hypothetical protein [Bacteriovoracaceae bacterium]